MEKPKILIVDDDPDIRRALKSRCGPTTTTRCRHGIAIPRWSSRRKNASSSSAGDGFVVLERLQDSDTLSNIPVIVLTTRDAQSNEQKTLQAGAAACFQKPADNFGSRLTASSPSSLRGEGRSPSPRLQTDMRRS
jgi:CheY-like chemotaxis protein